MIRFTIRPSVTSPADALEPSRQSGGSGPRLPRFGRFIGEWLEDVGHLVGADVVQQVVDDVEVSFGQALNDPHEWQIFLHGTHDEREAASTRLRLELEARAGP